MSIDAYGSFELKQAVVEGDIEHPTASILCALPHELQVIAVSKLKSIAESPTAEQVLAGIEAVAFDLSKARFDRSSCNECLHNTNCAKVECSVAFSPDLCLFKDCASAGARDPALLQKRQVNKFVGIEDDTLKPLASNRVETSEPVVGCELSDATAETADPPEAIDETPPQSGDFAMDDDAIWGDTEPALTQAEELDLAESAMGAAEVQNVECGGWTDRDDQYIEKARNGWWRASLKQALIGPQDDVLMSDFLCAVSFVQTIAQPHKVAVSNFRSLRDQQKTMETLSELVEHRVDSLPLDVVKDFLAELQFDICTVGGSSIHLLSALSLEELEAVADDFDVPSTDAMIKAYSQGSQHFAEALYKAIGHDALSSYAPPSLRVID